MEEATIVKMLQHYNQFETERVILKDYALEDIHQDTALRERYVYLSKRISLMNHWLALVSRKEALVLHHHLIEDLPWAEVCKRLDTDREKDGFIHERTLQRTQMRALAKIVQVMESCGGEEIDAIVKGVDALPMRTPGEEAKE